MTTKILLDSFRDWRDQELPLVLASVFDTEGSTYSKAGARMLINADGDFQGMLSGGCLEGDLAERAREVLNTGKAQMITYDLGMNEEELWGLGVGCDGVMRIFLQPLVAENDYAPFKAIARAYEGDQQEVAVTVLESERIMPGATLVTAGDERIVYDLTDEQAECLLGAAKSALESQASSSVSVEIVGARATILLALINPRIRLLVLGAGLDAVPVTRLADELGWRVTVVDHRPAYVESGNFETAERVVCCPAEEMSVNIDLPKFDAAIVMSHHLVSDRTYLTQLSDSGMQYVGLLGPIDRRRRLLKELGDAASDLQDRLHGPAGVDIGAQGPAAIALSILTEMYGVLADH